MGTSFSNTLFYIFVTIVKNHLLTIKWDYNETKFSRVEISGRHVDKKKSFKIHFYVFKFWIGKYNKFYSCRTCDCSVVIVVLVSKLAHFAQKFYPEILAWRFYTGLTEVLSGHKFCERLTYSLSQLRL